VADSQAVSKQVSTPTKKVDDKGSKLESRYSITELENATKKLGAKPECIYAALKENQKESFTLEEAKQIVNQFLKREVKK
jgi:hypothetical protein